MEFEDVSEKVQKEVRRIGLVLGVEKWMYNSSLMWERVEHVYFQGETTSRCVSLCLRKTDAWLYSLRIDGEQEEGEDDYCELYNHGEGPWHCEFPPQYAQLLARAVYQLDIENCEGEEELPTLSAHEKMQLRLSLPRDFWPRKWLDEEGSAQPK